MAGLVFCTPTHAASVVPNFTRGTVTSETTSTQTIVELIREVKYTTGESYTVSGTNINIPSNPGLDTNYTPVSYTHLTLPTILRV